MLDTQIGEARVAHKTATDALAEGDARYRDADKAQRLAHDALSGFRAELARVEERIKGLIAQRHQIERQVHETLGIDARRPPISPASSPSTRCRRKHRSNRRSSGSSPSASGSAGEPRRRKGIGRGPREARRQVTDRDDLIAAIAKLRAGIQVAQPRGPAAAQRSIREGQRPLPGAVHLAVRRRHGRAAIRRKR